MARVQVRSDDGATVVDIQETDDADYGTLHRPFCRRCSTVVNDYMDTLGDAVDAATVHADQGCEATPS
jgi:hypothetical protein